MILKIYTLIHVLISLMGIASGFVVLAGMMVSRLHKCWTKFFLVTTVLTSVTGFFFPVTHLTPGHVVGVISLVLLAVAIYALYGRQLKGGWRVAYVITAMLAQYLNVFVLVVQLYQKVPVLHALAPTQEDPAFKITQLVVLVIFIALIAVAAIKFRVESADA